MKQLTPNSLLFGNRPPVIARWMWPHQQMLGDLVYPIYVMEDGTAQFVDTYSLAQKNAHWTPINFEELWTDGYRRTKENPALAALREEFTVDISLSEKVVSAIVRLNDLFVDGSNMKVAPDLQRDVDGAGWYINRTLMQELYPQLNDQCLCDPWEDAIERQSKRKSGE